MTFPLRVLAVALGVSALLDWGAVLRGSHAVERVAKPLVVVLLGALALGLAPTAPGGDTVLVPVLVALALSLVGDLALLTGTEGRFLVGVGAFFAAHVAYVWALLVSPRAPGFPWWLVAAVPVAALLLVRFGRHVVRGAGEQRGPVFVYQLVILTLLLVAAWHGDPLVLAGCLLFVVSDTVLGWDRFVSEKRWAPVTVMVTYHAAQALIVVGLLT